MTSTIMSSSGIRLTMTAKPALVHRAVVRLPVKWEMNAVLTERTVPNQPPPAPAPLVPALALLLPQKILVALPARQHLILATRKSACGGGVKLNKIGSRLEMNAETTVHAIPLPPTVLKIVSLKRPPVTLEQLRQLRQRPALRLPSTPVVDAARRSAVPHQTVDVPVSNQKPNATS